MKRSWKPFGAVFCIALTLNMTGCMAWKTQPSPDQTIERAPRAVRVTRTDNSVVALRTPRIENDSLIGWSGSEQQETRVAIALTEVSRVQTRETDVLRTTGAVVGGSVLVLSVLTVAAFVAILSNWQ